MNIRYSLKLFFRKFGIELRKYNINNSFDFRLKHFLKIKKIDCVFDIGANTGQYATHLRKLGYQGQIISFEPLSKEFLKLKNKSKKDKKWLAFNFGIGDINKESLINISKNSLSSSILDMNNEHFEAEPTSKYVDNEKIYLKRLDDISELDLNNFNKIFVKIDTQGYEEQVLEGAKNILNKIEGFQLELSIYPMYKGQKLFNELYKVVEDMGFELWDLDRTFSNDDTGKILQIDGIFFKKN